MRHFCIFWFFLISQFSQAQPNWIYSGAPIGDTCISIYNLSGITITDSMALKHVLGQDSIRISDITGNPVALFIYRADATPNVSCGLPGMLANNRYFGVYPIGGTSPGYNAKYFYNGNPLVNPGNEPDLLMYYRQANNITVCNAWTNMSSALDTTINMMKKNLMSSRNEMILTQYVSALPIELVSFTASPINNTVSLSWVTASEINNDFFTIQRSNNGYAFEDLSYIEGVPGGNSYTTNYYNEIDNSPLSGTSYYRLKQTDFDGLTSISNIISVEMLKENEIKFYPNPASENITISNVNGTIKEIEIYNSVGEKVKTIKNVTNQISVYDLPIGIYYFKTKLSDNHENKFIVNIIY